MLTEIKYTYHQLKHKKHVEEAEMLVFGEENI